MATASHFASTRLLRLCRQPRPSPFLSNQSFTPAILATRLRPRVSKRVPIPAPCRLQSFMSSPAPGTATQDADEPRGFTGAEWDAATDARKIRLLLGTEPKGRPRRWGWVVYRTAYGTEFDGAWAALRDRIARQMGDSLSLHADAAMDWIFVEDAATLEGAGRDALRRHFADWAAAEAPDVDLATETGGRGARYEYFLQADTETLTSVLRLADAAPAATPYVNLVRAWPETLPEDIALDEDGNPCPAEDWMKMALDAVYPSNYIAMDHPETW